MACAAALSGAARRPSPVARTQPSTRRIMNLSPYQGPSPRCRVRLALPLCLRAITGWPGLSLRSPGLQATGVLPGLRRLSPGHPQLLKLILHTALVHDDGVVVVVAEAVANRVA